MKKWFLLAVAVLIGIGIYGITASALSFEAVERVPRAVEERIDPDHALQQIYRGSQSYIIFKTSGIVKHELEVDGEFVKMLLTVTQEGGDMKQHAYKLKTGDGDYKIAVYINGELVPFDVVSAGS